MAAPTVMREMHFNDFGKFYYSLLTWRQGGSLYAPTAATDVGVQVQFWNLNPPHLHLLLWPFAWLPIHTAFLIWTALNVLAAVWALVATIRETRVQPPRWVVAAALVSEPAFAWAITGQLSGLLMAAATMLWLAMRRGKWMQAGVVLGLTCSVKPFLGVFGLLWIVQRRWRALACAVAVGIAAVAIGVFVYGPSAYVEWMRVMKDVQWTGAVMNASMPALIGRTWTLQPLVTDPLALRIGSAAGVFVLATGVFAASRTRDSDRSILILLLTALLASPLGWVYYTWILVGPALVVWKHPSSIVRVALMAMLVPHVLLLPFRSASWAATIGSLYTWSLVFLWVASIVQVSTRPTVFEDAADPVGFH
jgi:hypothetical protein